MARMQHETTSRETWFTQNYGELDGRPVAYFCAEFGLHSSVPIYSGGLGVLAGDHCKAASDLGVPLVGVGLMYMKGYFDQRLRLDGWQEDSDDEYDISRDAARAGRRAPGVSPISTTVETSGRPVHVRAWRMMVGRVPIYLLDTNLEVNHPDDRGLMNKLYAGGPDLRVRQEWILGVGGVRVLRALGIEPAVWHANEGHAAFMMIERLRELTWRRARHSTKRVRQVRAHSVFTTHTPVPAGHDAFTVESARPPAPDRSGRRWASSGTRSSSSASIPRSTGQFHMTVCAHAALRPRERRLPPSRPGVAQPLARPLARASLGSGADRPRDQRRPPRHLDGQRRSWQLLDEHLGRDWGDRLDEPGFWDQVLTLDSRQVLGRARAPQAGARHSDPRGRAPALRRRSFKEAAQVVGAGTLLDPNALTIGFARRFATYKRANLIFRDIDRLRRLLVDPCAVRSRSSSPARRTRPTTRARKCSRASTSSPATPSSRAGSRSSRTTTCTSPTSWCRGWTCGSTCRGCRSRPRARAG